MNPFRRNVLRGALVAALGIGSVSLLWNGVFAEKATTESLGGKDRYLTALSTDKPMYRNEETVYVRGVILNATTHEPLKPTEQAFATIEVKGPKGDIVAGGQVNHQDSTIGFSWPVPKTMPGGEYTVKVTYPWSGYAPTERKFDIRAYRAPRLKSQITFLREGYGPGEKVTATVHVTRAEGGVPEGAKVTAVARVDGDEAARVPCVVDLDGNATASFELPKEIARGEGSLAFVIEDGGVVETASKTIPILLQTVDVQFYPEGGDFVAGLKNRVYVEARRPDGKPADIEFTIAPIGGNAALDFKSTIFKTEHEGRGRFEFTPEKGVSYAMNIIKPAGIKTDFKLPAVKEGGVVIQASKNYYGKDDKIEAVISAPPGQGFIVTLAKREVELDKASQPWKEGMTGPVEKTVSLDAKDADGVLMLTVWDTNGAPLAERLVYKQPKKVLELSITADRKSYVPGDKVQLTVKTAREGKPVSSVVGLTVSDDSVKEMIEKREQAPRLPVMVFLEPEVKELADAEVYLDEKNEKAPLAVDLLLGTQGWRRFCLQNPTEFIAQNGDIARRALALKIQSRVEMTKSGAMRGAGGGEGGVLRDGVAFGGAPGAPVPEAAAAPPNPQAAREAKDELKAVLHLGADQAGEARKDPKADKALPEAKVARRQLQAQQQAGQEQLERNKAQEPMQDALRHADEKQANMAFAKKRIAENFRQDMKVIREYAHAVRANRQPTDRQDFAETLYWNAGVKTNEQGEATISFHTSDAVTSFRVLADAFDKDGALGAGSSMIESVQPFYIEAKMPLEVTSGDVIKMPISFVNGMDSALADASVIVAAKGELKLHNFTKFELNGMERARRILEVKVGYDNKLQEMVFLGTAGVFEDKVTRTLSIKPKGFPIEANFGGLMNANSGVSHSLTIPDTVVPRSIVTKVAVYPTPLGNMNQALQRLIQDPNGCFEQTSSTSYPLTMAQQYFLSHTGVDPKMVEQSREKLDKGYAKLVGFWCPDRGYEWFGQDPGHEALTAFGLLHFNDMALVRDVDRNMIATTSAWLMKQRDGKGSFERKRRALHTWIEDKDCSDAYITWALLESGAKPADLKAEVDHVKAAGAASSNSYVKALAANVCALAGDHDSSKQLMDALVAKQNKEGAVDGGTATIVGSGGVDLNVETTALASLAWMRNKDYAGSVEQTMKYLADNCQGGRYGSTQATVLALRAIVNHDKLRAHPKAPGKVRVYVDGQPIGDALAFNEKTEGALVLPDVSELLSKGEHKIEVKMENGSEMPYVVSVTYNAVTPASSKECKLDLSVKLTKAEVAEGEALEANVTVENKTAEAIPTPTAIIGLPGGLEPRHDQLKELVKSGKVDAYEVLGREVVLYWRGMKAGQKAEFPLSLIAAIPGTYTGPASRAYLYYNDAHKIWVDGLAVNITPKG